MRIGPKMEMERWWPTLLLAVALGIGGIANPVSTEKLTLFGVSLPSLCLLKLIAGIPCPFCGLTRSWTNLFHGRWVDAFASHPLGPFLFAIFGLFCIYRLRFGKNPENFRQWAFGLAVLFLAVWIFRLFSTGVLFLKQLN